MAERDVWILGASMTKFGRYPDKDLIDLGAEAALAALDDAGVTMADMDVMGAGNLMEAASGVGQRIQKQVGQNGVPVYNVAAPLLRRLYPDAPPVRFHTVPREEGADDAPSHDHGPS